jgi:hypothetical protein
MSWPIPFELVKVPWPCFVLTLTQADIICLVGRWRSDEILCYLHIQAEPTMRGFSAHMLLQHGYFILLPNNNVPCF